MSHDPRKNDEPEEIGSYLIEEESYSFWLPVLWTSGGGLVVVAVGVAAAFAWLAAQRAMSPTVTQIRSPAELRSEAARAFGDFDPAADPLAGLSPAERIEREEILDLFRQLEAATRAGDQRATRKLVDVPRLFARMSQSGKLAGWSRTERFDLQLRVSESCTPDEFWAHMRVVAIVPVADDPGSRVVYVTGKEEEKQGEQSEARLWVARQGHGWKVYDWERLDLGMSKSQEWAALAWHTRAGTLGDFELRSATLRKFNQQLDAGDHAAARTTLLAVERMRCPSEFTDNYLAVHGYYWLWLGESDEAARCFEKVSRPEDVPGAWYGLMTARRWSRPQQALSHAEKYEAALGPSVTLCETKAQILDRLGRKSEAATEWKKVLRFDANHDQALNGLLVLLPERDKAAFAEHLDKTTDPVQTASKLASMIGWRDEAALTFLIDYVRLRQPAAPELKSLTALKHSVAGDHEQAAESHLQLLLAETDAAKQHEHAAKYLAAMTQLGRVVEGFDAIPLAVQPAAFDDFARPFFEDESEHSRGEFEQVLAHFRERHPDNPRGDVHALGLALRDQRFDEAERHARAALRRLDDQTSQNGGVARPANEPPKPAGTEDDAELRSSVRLKLAMALCHLGRVDEAWNLLPAEERFHDLISDFERDGAADRLSDLIRLQSASQPDDPEIPFARGRLAERADRTDEAIAEYRQALKKTIGKPPIEYQHALLHLFVVADRWQEYFESSFYDDTQLETLAADLVRSRRWQSFDELMNRHFNLPGRARLAASASEAAWERQRYAECAEFCALALKSPESGLREWQRGTVRDRQLASLLRQKNFDQAQKLAAQFRDEQTDPFAPAIACAAAGEFVNALSVAMVSAGEAGSATRLYYHAEVGGIFLKDEFAGLHDKFPVDLPYYAVNRTAVVLLKSPSEIDERQLADIVQQAAGPGSTVEVQSLTARDPKQRAYRVGFGSASLWLVAGTGRFDATLTLPQSEADDSPEQAALRATAAEWEGYLVIGTAGWTNSDRERLADVARRVARRLIGLSTIAIQLDQGFHLHAPDDTLLDQWETTKSVGDRAIRRALRLHYQPIDTVVATRQFQHELTAAARAFQPDQASPLEIIVASISDPVLDPVTIRVTKVSRNYNTFAFDGVLQTSSLTLPELRAGLPVHLWQHNVQAWRTGDTEFHWRP